MILEKAGSNYLFRFASFSRIRGLTHAVVCRDGGSSRPPFDGMNLSQGVGDDPLTVQSNRERLIEITGGVHVYTRQNHGTTIRVITRDELSRQEPLPTEPLPADALITDVPGIRLLIQTADCQAVMLVDPAAQVVANVHCGWRGSVANIIVATIEQMQHHFGTNPAHLQARISPSLGPCCAEFVYHEKELPLDFRRFMVGDSHFDFWQISAEQLRGAGLQTESIQLPDVCTSCSKDYFSYRRAVREGDPVCGRHGSVIVLDEDSQ